MGTETSKESSSSHGWSNHSQPYTTDVAAFEAEQIKMREISRMDQTIRSRLHQGVKYNMKVLLCGERGTGKTMLWRRLQGQPFSYEHESTAEIQSATINWNSPLSSRTAAGKDDVVKVEVWDVVDRAIVVDKPSSESVAAEMVYNLTGEAEEGRHAIVPLDASIVDIYKDSHAVIFMINPFHRESLQYVRDKYPQVPGHVSILLIVNFKDKSTQISNQSVAVALQEVQSMCAEIRSFRSNCANDDVTVLETSLLDCYGLLNLHHYLDVPFLRLKQRILQEQLASVESDLQLCYADMERKTSNESSYEEYLRQYNARKRERMKQHSDLDETKPTTVIAEPPVSVPTAPTAKSPASPLKTVVHKEPPVPPVVVPPHPPLTIKAVTAATAAPAASTSSATHAINAPAEEAKIAAVAQPSPSLPAAAVSVSVTDNSDTPNVTNQISAANSDSTASQYGGSVAPYEPSPYAVSNDKSVTPESSDARESAILAALPQAAASVSIEAVNHSLSYSDDGNSAVNNDAAVHSITTMVEQNNPVSRGDSPVETAVLEVPPNVDGDALLVSFLAQVGEEEEEVKGSSGEDVTAANNDTVNADVVAGDTIAVKEGDSDSEASGASPTPQGTNARANSSNNRSTHSALKKIPIDSDSSDDDNERERGNAKLNQKVNFGGKMLRSVKSVAEKSPTAGSTGMSSGGLRKARPSGMNNKGGNSSSSDATSSNAVLKGVTDLEDVDL